MAQTKKKSNSRSKSNNSRSNNHSNNRKTTNQRKQTNRNVIDTIYFLIILAIAILLFISNFGIGGLVGSAVSNFLFGIFGLVNYAFPIAFFYICFSIFGMRRNGTGTAIVKFVSGILFVFFLCTFASLIVFQGEPLKPLDAFSYDFDRHIAGGLFGGMLHYLFFKGFGLVGAYVIDIVVLLICLFLLIERAPINLFTVYLPALGRKILSFFPWLWTKMKSGSSRRRERVYEDEDEISYSDKQPGVTYNTDLKKSDHSANELFPKDEVSELFPDYDKDIETPIVQSTNRISLSSGEKNDNVKELFSPENAEVPTDRQLNITGNVISSDKPVKAQAVKAEPVKTESVKPEPIKPAKEPVKEVLEDESVQQNTTWDPNPNYANYELPPTDLLDYSSNSGGSTREALERTANKLIDTLSSFGVNATVSGVSCGPTVTRFEIEPPVGVKVSKILNLADDIKLNLACADIRMEAPIPGKAAVGIEIENAEKTTVAFRELIESDEFKTAKSNLTFAVGKDIGGKVIVHDVAKMPHLLIAGTTGSGKSVCSNSLILSILYKAKPEDVKFLMIDPKRVELSMYNKIPHMLMPVVTDAKIAAGALSALVDEMTNRYNLFTEKRVRDIAGYNKVIEEENKNLSGDEKPKEKLPQIVVVIDELAELMMAAANEVEASIVRLAQLARAAGIHLVIATQRPSVNVVTGLIKANMPSRLALSLKSNVDSRTILDMGGAEKLLGKGDMLFLPQGMVKPVRIQGAWISDDEINRVIDFIGNQNVKRHESHFEEKVEKAAVSANQTVQISDGTTDSSAGDPLAIEAAQIIIDKEKASIGMLQRYLKVGFNRAARIMDELEEMGVVGPEMGTKPRTVLMDQEQFANWLEENG